MSETTTRVVTGKVRLSFPYLFKPRPGRDEGQDPKYSVMLLIPKSDKDTIKRLRDAEALALKNGIASKFGGKKPAKMKDSILHDADEDGTAEDYPERTGCLYMNVSASTSNPPGVVDRQAQPILDESEVYSGVYARVSLTAFAYDAAGSKGISFGLNNVQVLGGGDRLAGGPRAEDEFDALDDDEDDDDLI